MVDYIINNENNPKSNIEAIKWFFDQCHVRNINYLVLRNASKLPIIEGHDIDIFIDKKDLNTLSLLIKEMASNFKLQIYKHIPMPYANRYYLKGLNNEKDIILDFHVDEQWMGAVFLNIKNILPYREKKYSVFSAHDVHASLAPYIVTLLSTGLSDNKYTPCILKACSDFPNLFHETCITIFGATFGELFYEIIKQSETKRLEPLVFKIKLILFYRSFIKEPFATCKRFLIIIMYKIWFGRILRIYPP